MGVSWERFLKDWTGWSGGRARAVPPPEPHPQEEHPEPYQGEELEVVPKPLRSPIVPCR